VPELLIVAALIFLNGLFALSELAVVSARRPRLKALAASGRKGANRALALASDPGRFLSAVQIGITLIGIINGAYSGEAFGVDAANALKGSGVPENIAGPLGYGIVIAVITYLSVIVGELVPKHLALRNAEGIACAVAPAMTVFSKMAAPGVWLLDASTRLVFRLFGQATASKTRVTHEEIRMLIAEAETAGVLEEGEREMISGVMRLPDRPPRGVYDAAHRGRLDRHHSARNRDQGTADHHATLASAGGRALTRRTHRCRADARASRGDSRGQAARHPSPHPQGAPGARVDGRARCARGLA
jgi:putative hemolysin